jgi:hypothetical protein
MSAPGGAEPFGQRPASTAPSTFTTQEGGGEDPSSPRRTGYMDRPDARGADGRDARRSSANVRLPATAQVEAVQPFALDRLPGTTPAGHGRWQGGGRAFGACCFAGKLRSPAAPTGEARVPGPLVAGDPTATPTSLAARSPTAMGTPAGGVPLASAVEAVCPAQSPLGGVERPRRKVRFARLIHAARPRSWRTYGPRRLRRQSEPVLVATHGDPRTYAHCRSSAAEPAALG